MPVTRQTTVYSFTLWYGIIQEGPLSCTVLAHMQIRNNLTCLILEAKITLYVLILLLYIDATDVQRPNLEDSKYAHGILKVHHVDTVATGHVDLYLSR